MKHSAVLILTLNTFCVFSESALYGQALGRCQFSSSDGHDAVYLEQYYFNKMLFAQYNSTLGKMVGYTKKAMDVADTLNQNPEFVTHEKWKTRLCKQNSQLAFKGLLRSVEPYVRLRSAEAASRKHPAMLICSMYNFYPKQIIVTWLRDGKEVTSDVTSAEEHPNGNWLYQIHSYLEYTPRSGEKITCMVEHASLKEPKLYDWEPAPDPGMHKIIIGTAGLVLGLFFLAAGLIYYKKKSAVRVMVPITEVFHPGDTL
ncbi:hypothetical protein Q5P01_011221 [Channa striata]|uniref:Ig-like domain-containing protein n=1 Tax=Channa striata TaxID=64152 RepID=A0AA88MZ12_CHASR|nr:hypothetical protein Q5P01_011221 [Channa striata]